MSESSDPGVPSATQRAAGLLESHRTTHRVAGSTLRIGVAGWTDRTLTAPGVFYPEGVRSAEARLRYYASVFPLVEVDSAYYALPTRQNAELWVERTPDDFTFNIKAFALMTGHPAELSRLPASLRTELPRELHDTPRAYSKDLPPTFVREVWRLFLDAIGPLQAAGKLGAVLLQYPRWFVPGRRSERDLEKTRRLLGDHTPAAVEFRNALWLAPARRERTMSLLRELGFSYVCVDEPQGTASSVPPILEVTNDELAIVRFHGRRQDVWDRPGIGVLERFRYLYSRDELAEWVRRLSDLASRATVSHIIFNNCYANYGTTNALEIGELISRIYHS